MSEIITLEETPNVCIAVSCSHVLMPKPRPKVLSCKTCLFDGSPSNITINPKASVNYTINSIKHLLID